MNNGSGFLEIPLLDDTFSFFNGEDLVHAHVSNFIDNTIGVKGNRDGIGAKVKVVPGDLTQIDEVRSGGSYISQSDLRLHFGLEKRTKVDLIEIRWPDGVVDKVTNVSVNKILTVKEGKGIVEQRDFKKPAAVVH